MRACTHAHTDTDTDIDIDTEIDTDTDTDTDSHTNTHGTIWRIMLAAKHHQPGCILGNGFVLELAQ